MGLQARTAAGRDVPYAFWSDHRATRLVVLVTRAGALLLVRSHQTMMTSDLFNVQWKYLEMPYMEVPINKRVFLNGERARSWNSLIKNIPVRARHLTVTYLLPFTLKPLCRVCMLR